MVKEEWTCKWDNSNNQNLSPQTAGFVLQVNISRDSQASYFLWAAVCLHTLQVILQWLPYILNGPEESLKNALWHPSIMWVMLNVLSLGYSGTHLESSRIWQLRKLAKTIERITTINYNYNDIVYSIPNINNECSIKNYNLAGLVDKFSYPWI